MGQLDVSQTLPSLPPLALSEVDPSLLYPSAATNDDSAVVDTIGMDTYVDEPFDADAINHIMGASASSGAGATLPTPVLPPSGSPTMPDNLPEGALGYLSRLLDYVAAHPGDITALYKLMQFITKMSQLSEGGKLPVDVQALLDSAGGMNAITSAMNRAAIYAFFAGYTDKNGNHLTGEAALDAYVSETMATLVGMMTGGHGNPLIKQMITTLNDFNQTQFVSQHRKPDGSLYWKFGDIEYNWTNPGDPNNKFNDQYFISEIINGNKIYNGSLDGTGTDDPFRADLKKNNERIQRDYRVLAFDELLGKYPDDPMMAVTLFLMTAFDDHLQCQQSGLNETTDVLTDMTNEVASRLTTLLQKLGYTNGQPNMTVDEMKDFIRTLCNGTTLMNVKAQLTGISSDWDKNVFEAIKNITVPDPHSKTIPQGNTTLGAILFSDRYTDNDKRDVLCGLNPAAGPSNDPAHPVTPNPGYQEIVSIAQQAGSYITGTSKTVSMQLQTSTDTSSQLLKTWGTMMQDVEQQIIKMISNYRPQ